MLRERLDAPGPIMVTGASGAGKSSLLHAGLLPELAAGTQIAGSETWPASILLTPAASPLDELANGLGGDPIVVRRCLAEEPERAHLLARAALDGRPGARLVIVVDQFEELFTLHPDPADAERRAFVTALHSMATTPTGADGRPAALVVVGVRADHIGHFVEDPLLVEAFRQRPFVVQPMTEAQLRQAIISPAKAAGTTVDADLVDMIFADLRMSDRPATGVLPLLSHALMLTWRGKSGKRMTVEDYTRTGRVRRALEEDAERTLAGLSDRQRELVPDLLRRMVVIDSEGHPARRSVLRTALDGSDPDVASVLAAFARGRFLVLHEQKVEIAHDILLEAWPRLRGWLKPLSAGHALHHQLIDDAAEWQQHHRDPAYLYRGVRLTALEPIRTDSDHFPLSEVPRDFLDASVRSARRTVLRRRAVLVSLSALAVVSLVLSVVAGLSAADARRASAVALSRQLASESLQATEADPRKAMMLAVRAWQASRTVQARGAVLSARMLNHAGDLGDEQGSNRVALSPDGRWAATGGFRGELRLWDVRSHRQVAVLEGHEYKIDQVGFSPDGSFLATGSINEHAPHDVRVWEIPSGRQVQRLPNASAPFAWSPDGTLATLSLLDGTPPRVLLWQPRDVRESSAFPLDKGFLPLHMAFDSTGTRLALGGLGGRIHRIPDGKRIAILKSGSGPVTVAASSAGTLAAAGTTDKQISLWDFRTGALIRRIEPHVGLDGVSALSFTRDGDLLVAGSGADLRTWNPVHGWTGKAFRGSSRAFVLDLDNSADGGTVIATGPGAPTRLWHRADQWLTGQSASATLGGVAFDPTGKKLITGDSQGGVSTWNAATGETLASTAGRRSDYFFTPVAYAPDGTSASGTDNGSVQVTGPDGRRRGLLTTGQNLQVGDLAFSPDGRSLVASASLPATSGTQNNVLRLWDTAGLRVLSTADLGNARPTHLAFTPDGARILVSTTDLTAAKGSVQIRQTSDLSEETAFASGDQTLTTLAVNPAARTFASGGSDGEIKVWDTSGHRQLAYGPHPSSIRALAYSPDGTTLATATSGDTVVRLWRAGTLWAALSGHKGAPNRIAFSPDGTTLAVTDANGQVGLWNTDPDKAARHLCDQLTGPTLPADWKALGFDPASTPCSL